MTLKSVGKIVSFSVLALGLASAALLGQTGATGALSGVVTDPSGAIMVSVPVTVRNAGTGAVRTATTDQEGRWTIPALPVGTYDVTYAIANFKKLTQTGVAVEAGVPRNLPAQLEVEAAPGQVISVAESVELATPDTAATFAQITGQELTQVPTSTRSFTHLLSAEAGVSSDLPPVLTNGNGNISPSVNGTRTTSTSLSFNGIDATNLTSNEGSLSNNIAPAPETLEEVKLQTSMYDASTGRSGGGNFQLITKSGSNAFHGSAVWYVQNEIFNANDFFFNKDGIDRPKARRNEGGFTLGGPIVKDRVFFFGGYQRTQSITGFVPTATSVSVLPEALRLVNGARTKQSIWDAFNASNPNFAASVPKAECNSPTDRACISDVALNILNLRNPVTGDYFVPAPRADATFYDTDINVAGSNGGNRLLRQRNVEPSRFTQDQFTTKIDANLSNINTLSGTFFFSKFPGYDSFPDPASLVSPVTLKRDDRNRTLAISDTHIFSPSITNEARFGYFFLNNTRVLDDPFLSITNESIGVPNPAVAFDQGPGTLRLGHYVGRPGTAMERFSFGGPNDSFNRREQTTFSFGDTVSWVRNKHVFRFGGEFKSHRFNSALPEEQATEFEKYDNFTQLLRGVATEADTQFGITEKRFRMKDVSWFVTDDFKLTPHVTLQLGLRWEWFGWPEERNGYIGNFDPSLVSDSNNPLPGFLVPSNAENTGFIGVDTAIAASTRTSTNHTLNGQDLNNFAPRFGFAWTPGSTNRLVVRGGYGIFFDRPSAAFINTIFSNYPFLREEEVTFPTSSVPLTTAWSQQDPNFPFNQYLPNRVVRSNNAANGNYQIRDGTSVTRGADGSLNPTDPATGQPFVGNIAETFEFRAVDRNLRTPYIQQWNLGAQYELTKNLLIEVRYVGSKGTKLLQAVSFTQGYDLNDPSTPDAIFKRFNDAYVAAGSANGPLNPGATERERGVGKAFGFANPALGGMLDYNLANSQGANSNVITFEGRARYLGFDVPEAILLGNSAFSNYHSGQIAVTKRFSRGMGFELSYTYSRSMDNASADPGSTAGGGKPDLPNVGFTSQGDAFDTRSNYARSDFDRTHRFSASFLYELPTFGSTSKWARGWNFSGFYQVQSGVPFTIFSPEQTVGAASQYSSARLGASGLYRLAFGRPSLCGTFDQLTEQKDDKTEGYFNGAVLCSPLSLAGGYPNNRGFGNLGRNALRGPGQQRFDLGFAKKTPITESVDIEFRWDVFNVFNNVNFATPNSVMQDQPTNPNATTDYMKITDTVGGPRVMQFGARLTF